MKSKRCRGHEFLAPIWRKNHSQIEFFISTNIMKNRSKVHFETSLKELQQELTYLNKKKTLKGMITYKTSRGSLKKQKFILLQVKKIIQKKYTTYRWVPLKEVPQYFVGAQGTSSLHNTTWIKLYTAAHKVIQKGF